MVEFAIITGETFLTILSAVKDIGFTLGLQMFYVKAIFQSLAR